MSGELSLNVTSLADTIRDKVRATIAATIPDDQINSLIKSEYDNFFNVIRNHGYHDPNPRSDFQRMVYAEVDTQIKEKVKEAVGKEIARYTGDQWSEEGKKVVERFVKEYAPIAMAGLSEMIVRNAIQAFSQGRSF